MIISNLKVANALKALSEECRKHTRCTNCPVYDTDLSCCLIQTIDDTGMEHLHVTQRGDNDYNIHIG